MMKCAVMYMLSNGFNLFIPPCLDAQVAFLGRCYSVKIFTYTLLLKPLRIIACHHHNLFFLSPVYVEVSEFKFNCTSMAVLAVQTMDLSELVPSWVSR